MTPKEFYRACEHFDWHYEMSDDHHVWMSGEAAKARLLAQAPYGSENRRIWDAWCAHEFSGAPWGSPKAPRPTEPSEPKAMKWYYKVLGGHTHVRVFMNGGSCGDLCFRNEEFALVQERCPWIQFINETPAE